ncbi:hypothetical protein CDL12_28502 [Handroanthus impetiginosus]|uniref:Uncharacterized protein n=1 Tax=Handroanthus impetiginosus TaxID=429701 RepID=A0A2G9G112_9LAMI|nr:hypothetical protein CDL12_28502 [Handroanthus impetiginosus]
MMNDDGKFEQQWEIRGREVDEDSLSDEIMDKRHKFITDLVLPENDEANDVSRCLRNDNYDTYNSVHKKIEPSKKKNLVQKKSNKKKRNGITKEMVMLEDLKVFADSLISELMVARDNMFADMKHELRKMVPSRPNLETPKKNKVCPLDRVKSVGRNLESNVPCKFSKAVEEAVTHENDGLRPPTTGHMILMSDSDQIASSSYLTLPTVIPKLQFQNHRNGFHMNDRIPTGGPMNNSGSENNFYNRFSEFDPDQGFGNFPHISSRSVDFLGENCIQKPGFPVPLHQGTEHGSNMSSLTYGENSLLNNIKVCPSSTLRFPSDRKFANNISSYAVHKTAGEFEVRRS